MTIKMSRLPFKCNEDENKIYFFININDNITLKIHVHRVVTDGLQIKALNLWNLRSFFRD